MPINKHLDIQIAGLLLARYGPIATEHGWPVQVSRRPDKYKFGPKGWLLISLKQPIQEIWLINSEWHLLELTWVNSASWTMSDTQITDADVLGYCGGLGNLITLLGRLEDCGVETTE